MNPHFERAPRPRATAVPAPAETPYERAVREQRERAEDTIAAIVEAFRAFLPALLAQFNVPAAAPAAAPPPQVWSSFKNPVPPPRDYDGTAAKYEDFRSQLNIYMAGFHQSQAGQRVLIALNLLKDGDAATFARQFQQHHNPNTIPWTEFLNLLDQRFRDPRYAEVKRDEFWTFIAREFDTSQDLRGHFARLEELRTDAVMMDPAYDILFIDELKKSLPRELVSTVMGRYRSNRDTAKQIFEHQNPGMPTPPAAPLNYQEFKRFALHGWPDFQSRLSKSRADESTNWRSRESKDSPSTSTSTSKNRPSHSMDRNNVRRDWCGKKGHDMSECPDKSKPQFIRHLVTEQAQQAELKKTDCTQGAKKQKEKETEDFSDPQ